MDLIVCAREETEPAYPSGTTVNGVEPGSSGAVTMKGIQRSTGNESVLKLVKYICGVHGINLEAVKFINAATQDTQQEGLDASADDLLEDPYGWPELQIGIIREALAIAEALPGT
jgi:hypothetical protein